MKVFSFKLPRKLKAELDRLANANPNITKSEAVRRAIWETIKYAREHERLPPIFQDFYDGRPFIVTSIKIDDDLDRELSKVAAWLNTTGVLRSLLDKSRFSLQYPDLRNGIAVCFAL